MTLVQIMSLTKNDLKAFALISFFAFLLSACGGGSSSSSNSRSASQIGTVGDSIAVGYGGVAAWPDLVRAKTGVAVVDESRAGRHAEFGSGAVMRIIANNELSHLMVMLGVNDAKDGRVNQAINAMQYYVAYANEQGVVPVIGTIPAVIRDSFSYNSSKQISEGYRNLSGSYILADIDAAFDDNPIYYQSDLVHMSNEGEDLIATVFANAL